MKYPCKNPFKLREASSAELVAYIEVGNQSFMETSKKVYAKFLNQG